MPKELFRTARLLCRSWAPDDIDHLYAVYSDPVAMRWVDDGKPISRQDCERWMTVTQTNYRVRGYGMFALDLLGGEEAVGFCGLVHPGGQEDVELKYAFAREYWGRGLASEAVPALLEYGADKHSMESIIATVDMENLASQRVLTKSGFVREGDRACDGDSGTLVFRWRSSRPKHSP